MKDSHARFARVAVVAEHRADGTILLDNAIPLPAFEGTLPDRLAHWAVERPAAVFLSEAHGDTRRSVTYGEAAQTIDRLSAHLLALPVSIDRPLTLIGANSIAHALVMLAATRVGLPVAVISPTYCSAVTRPWAKLQRMIERLDSSFVLADDAACAGDVFAAFGRGDIQVRPLRDLAWIDDLPLAEPKAVDRAAQAVSGDTVAKLLFTSGSTGAPKAVMNTQAMMVSNMEGLCAVWPFLGNRPPVLVDWLPWSHTFGGNCCFNIALYFGGTLHIDDGRPLPGHIARTIATLRRHRPTAYFNVPAGYEALLPFLEADHDFAAAFFGALDVAFNAGAALPERLRTRLETLADTVTESPPPIVGGWGSTETAPFSTVLYHDTPHPANLGVPLPGTTVKLVPWADSFELRVRGPNVMPGYWRDSKATEVAFDDEGFCLMGDAGKLAHPGAPEQGIVFDGRVSENFKLSTGTWVNVGALRLALISALDPLVSDAVIAGEGRDEPAALLFCNQAACIAVLGDPADAPQLEAVIAERLQVYNDRHFGSSTRVSRFAILAEPPSAADGEITDKGYLNQRVVLRRRHSVVERLYAGPIERAEAVHQNIV